ncbi:hypothetical protein [Pantoea agglomerans]|uniref:hypothetical protein n=1 Tax=Enterobacter agglomerans TaxID=549 RepID=UPI0021D796FD|nr:hypothetical protein [Pantoea agglomerans]
MDWLKVLSIIIPSIALVFSINARLKRFNNERISVYKDMKNLSSELKMESYEIIAIDDELKKLILREATGIYEITLAGRLIKILSCNSKLEEFKRKRLKKLIHCVSEKEVSLQDNVRVTEFYLDKILFKKRAREGVAFIIALFLGFITFYIAGNSSLVREEYFWGTIQLIMSLASSITMFIAICSYPALWGYNSHKKFVAELKEFKSPTNQEKINKINKINKNQSHDF